VFTKPRSRNPDRYDLDRLWELTSSVLQRPVPLQALVL
jgi:hypothetical protein